MMTFFKTQKPLKTFTERVLELATYPKRNSNGTFIVPGSENEASWELYY